MKKIKVFVIPGERSYKVSDMLKHKDIEVRYYKSSKFSMLSKIGHLFSILSKRPDVVIIDRLGVYSLLLRAIKGIAGFKMIVRGRGDYWGQYKSVSKSRNPLKKFLLKLQLLCGVSALKSSDLIISVSEYQKSIVLKNIKYDKNKIKVIPTPVDLKKFRKTNNAKDINLLTVINFNFREKIKGLKVLVDDLIPFFKKNNNVILVVAGGGSELNGFKKYISDKDLSKRVVLLGRVGNIEKLYNRAKILIYPSLLDAYPSVIAEAKACELPIITNEFKGNSNLIKNGYNGYVIRTGDSKELAKRISNLLKSKSMRDELGKNGRKEVKSRNDKNRISSDFVKEVKKLI